MKEPRSMAVHVVRVYHGHFVKRESNPHPGATNSKIAASLRPRCNSAILVRTHTNISKRTIGVCLVSKTFTLAPLNYMIIIELHGKFQKDCKLLTLFQEERSKRNI